MLLRIGTECPEKKKMFGMEQSERMGERDDAATRPEDPA
jgi:hypothetical protein